MHEIAIKDLAIDDMARKVLLDVRLITFDRGDHRGDRLRACCGQIDDLGTNHAGHEFGTLDRRAWRGFTIDSQDGLAGPRRLASSGRPGRAEADNKQIPMINVRHYAAQVRVSWVLSDVPSLMEQHACS